MPIRHTFRINGKGKTKTEPITPVKAIRLQCIECMGFQKGLIPGCTSKFCSLYPFRMGKNPSKKEPRKKPKPDKKG